MALQVAHPATQNPLDYIRWQNRAFSFYLGARLLLLNEQYSPATFCGYQSIELLMKATLVYWDRSFDPKRARHKIKGMSNTIINKVKGGKGFKCPTYFYADKRFQQISRYPAKGKGISIPASFLNDLDNVFSSLIKLVPFQFNTELIWALTGENKKNLLILRKGNKQVRGMRNILKKKNRYTRHQTSSDLTRRKREPS